MHMLNYLPRILLSPNAPETPRAPHVYPLRAPTSSGAQYPHTPTPLRAQSPMARGGIGP